MLAQNRFSVEATTWHHDKQGAISLSFDDACYTQYKFAFPVLDNFNIKATFSLVGEWTHEHPEFSAEPDYFEIKKMGWNQIIELQKKGHEIAAHGYKHEKYNKHLPEEELVRQMKSIIKLIEEKTKAKVYTLHYPYSYTSDKIVKASIEAGFLFCRTGREFVNPASPDNMNLLFSKAILNNNTPDTSQLSQWIHDTKGKWLILMYHHIFPENLKEDNILKLHNVKNTYSLYPEVFEKHIMILANSNYWMAPISTVGKYIVERDNIELSTLRFLGTFKIKTSTSLDTAVYDQPVTIKIKLPWKKIEVHGSQNDGILYVNNNELLIDILPGNTVVIKRKK